MSELGYMAIHGWCQPVQQSTINPEPSSTQSTPTDIRCPNLLVGYCMSFRTKVDCKGGKPNHKGCINPPILEVYGLVIAPNKICFHRIPPYVSPVFHILLAYFNIFASCFCPNPRTKRTLQYGIIPISMRIL